MLATGGSDAVVNLWYDSTASDKEEAFLREVSCLDLIFGGCVYILELEMFFCTFFVALFVYDTWFIHLQRM